VIRRLRNPKHSILSEVCWVASEIKRRACLIFELLSEPLTYSLPVTTRYSQINSSPGGGGRRILYKRFRYSYPISGEWLWCLALICPPLIPANILILTIWIGLWNIFLRYVRRTLVIFCLEQNWYRTGVSKPRPAAISVSYIYTIKD
jgi:hypothetical protein